MPGSSSQNANAAVAVRAAASLLLVSGAVALVYEVVWQRQFALVLGSAASATAAVLAAYFAGLGAGSLAMGKLAGRFRRPLRVYAALEALVGAGALLVSPILGGLENSGVVNSAGGVVGKIHVVFAAVLLPTFCMGGTLPLLGNFVDAGRRRLGLTAGWLYVANTVGAGVGAVLMPFWLLPTFGLSQTIRGCAGVNGLLALFALWLDRGSPVIAAEPASKQVAPAEGAAVRSDLWLAFASGVATFALQVLWNRAFAQIHENSMYSFAVIVAAVIFALAFGAQLARVGLRRGFAPQRLAGGAWALGGAAIAVGPALFLHATHGLSYLSGGDWAGHATRLAWLAAGFVMPPMTLLGVGLPAIMEHAGARQGGDGRAGESVSDVLGRLLAANVAGSVIGALAAGFVLPQWIGVWGAMGMLAAALMTAGLGLWLRVRRRTGWLLGAGGVAGALLLARVDLPRVKLGADEVLLSEREGPHGIAAVVERPGSRRLKLNNHYGLGGTASTGDERMQAHVPLLLHPAPRSVAFLGLGTGISAGGALFHPVEKVTVVELVPEVIAASREFFGEENEHVLDDRRTRVVADDARHFLRGTTEKFDVIVGDLVVPWRAGEGSLFTREQFVLARRALAPGGIFCQWLPLFQLSETETRILLRTFLSVFPEAQIWRGDFSPTEPAIALIGGAAEGGMRTDVETVRRRLREMRADPANPQLAAAGVFWMQRVGAVVAGDLTGTDQRINSEDRPWVELLGPKLHGGGSDAAELFVGRRLQGWLDEVRAKASGRVTDLSEPERTTAAAGRVLAELILRMAERDQVGVETAQERLRRELPEGAYRALFPE